MAGGLENLDTVEPLAARLARHGFTQAALWGYVSLRRSLLVEGALRLHQAARWLTALIVPFYFLWLAFAGVREIGPSALFGAVVPVALLLALRRGVLPRLQRAPAARPSAR